jgi:hypothetical protein
MNARLITTHWWKETQPRVKTKTVATYTACTRLFKHQKANKLTSTRQCSVKWTKSLTWHHSRLSCRSKRNRCKLLTKRMQSRWAAQSFSSWWARTKRRLWQVRAKLRFNNPPLLSHKDPSQSSLNWSKWNRFRKTWTNKKRATLLWSTRWPLLRDSQQNQHPQRGQAQTIRCHALSKNL